MDERPLAASAIYLINFAIHIRQVSAKNNADYESDYHIPEFEKQ